MDIWEKVLNTPFNKLTMYSAFIFTTAQNFVMKLQTFAVYVN